MCYGPCCHEGVLVVCHGRQITKAGNIGAVTRLDQETGDIIWTADLGIATLTGKSPGGSVQIARRPTDAVIDEEGNIYVTWDFQLADSTTILNPALNGTWSAPFPNGGIAKLTSDGDVVFISDFPGCFLTGGQYGWYASGNISLYQIPLLRPGASIDISPSGDLWVGTLKDSNGDYVYRVSAEDGQVISRFGHFNSFSFPFAWPNTATSGRLFIETSGSSGTPGYAGRVLCQRDGKIVVHQLCIASATSTANDAPTIIRMDQTGAVEYATNWTTQQPASSITVATERFTQGMVLDTNDSIYKVSQITTRYNLEVATPPAYFRGFDQYAHGQNFGGADKVSRSLVRFGKTGGDPLEDVKWKHGVPHWPAPWGEGPGDSPIYDWVNTLTDSEACMGISGNTVVVGSYSTAKWAPFAFDGFQQRWREVQSPDVNDPNKYSSLWNIFGADTTNGSATFIYWFALDNNRYPGYVIPIGCRARILTTSFPGYQSANPSCITTSEFVMPIVGGVFSVSIDNSSGIVSEIGKQIGFSAPIGHPLSDLFVYFTLLSIPNSSTVILRNDGYRLEGIPRNKRQSGLFPTDICGSDSGFYIVGGFNTHGLVVESISSSGVRIWQNELQPSFQFATQMCTAVAFRGETEEE